MFAGHPDPVEAEPEIRRGLKRLKSTGLVISAGNKLKRLWSSARRNKRLCLNDTAFY